MIDGVLSGYTGRSEDKRHEEVQTWSHWQNCVRGWDNLELHGKYQGDWGSIRSSVDTNELNTFFVHVFVESHPGRIRPIYKSMWVKTIHPWIWMIWTTRAKRMRII